MKGFQEKRKFKRILYSNVSIIILLVIIAFLARSVWSSWEKYSLTKKARAESEAKFNDLTTSEKLLKERTEKLETERGKEEILRERYDTGKDGEKLINVVDVTE